MSEVESRIRTLVSSQLRVSPSRVSASSGWNDLGGLSSSYPKFISAVEKEFRIRIPSSEAGSFKTIGELIEFVERAT